MKAHEVSLKHPFANSRQWMSGANASVKATIDASAIGTNTWANAAGRGSGEKQEQQEGDTVHGLHYSRLSWTERVQFSVRRWTPAKASFLLIGWQNGKTLTIIWIFRFFLKFGERLFERANSRGGQIVVAITCCCGKMRRSRAFPS